MTPIIATHRCSKNNLLYSSFAIIRKAPTFNSSTFQGVSRLAPIRVKFLQVEPVLAKGKCFGPRVCSKIIYIWPTHCNWINTAGLGFEPTIILSWVRHISICASLTSMYWFIISDINLLKFELELKFYFCALAIFLFILI